MEPITGLLMLVSSIGMQFATNNANNKQSEKLAELQRRYQDLLDRQRIEHSQQLQIEMNDLQIAMENEVHLLRMKEIENSHDEIIEGLVHGQDIDAWPLYVLPFVIKGKSFGTKIGGGAKTISVHCFLTPSNSAAFNRVLYSELDIKLQSDINTNWSTRSTHPIFYYGGAWRDKSADINHIINCVDQLATELGSMPCIVITPLFEADGVSFRINMWGMGDGKRHSADFVFKNADENTKLDEIKFSYNYSVKQKFDKSDFEDFGDDALKELDKFLDTTRDEFSAYLQTLIGFITDKYFWSMYGAAPVLPSLLANSAINTDGLSWLVNDIKQHYRDLLELNCNSDNSLLHFNHILKLVDGATVFIEKQDKINIVERIILQYCNSKLNKTFQSLNDIFVLNNFEKNDISFLESCKDVLINTRYESVIEELLNQFPILKFDYDVLTILDIDSLLSMASLGNATAMYRLGEIFEYSLGPYYDPEKSAQYFESSFNSGFLLSIFMKAYTTGDLSIIKENNVKELFNLNSDCVQVSIFKSFCHYHGIYVNASLDSAMKEIDQHEDSTHPLVSFWASTIVKDAYGVSQKELFVELLTRSAELNYVRAQRDLIFIYENGDYVVERPDLAFEYAQKASLQGDDEALLKLGIYYLKGYYTRQNKAKAKDLIRMAAERGNIDAIDIIKKLSS